MSTLIKNNNTLIFFILTGAHRFYLGCTYPILILGNMLTLRLIGKILSIVSVQLERHATMLK